VTLEKRVTLDLSDEGLLYDAFKLAACQATPPVPFDVARQLRVFEAYLKYAEARLTGVASQSRKKFRTWALTNACGSIGITIEKAAPSSMLESNSLQRAHSVKSCGGAL
jgi:hypothetical protein